MGEQDRGAILLVFAKHSESGEFAFRVIRSFSANANAVPGPYKNAQFATVDMEQGMTAKETSDSSGFERWRIRDDAGGVLRLLLRYRAGAPLKSGGEMKIFGGPDPAFFRVYRTDKASDFVKSAPNKVDRIDEFQFDSTIAEFSNIFDGTQRVISIWTEPLVSAPSAAEKSGIVDGSAESFSPAPRTSRFFLQKCSTAPDYVLREMSSHAALNHYGESQVSGGMILLNQYWLTDCSGFAGWRIWVEPAVGGSGRHVCFPQFILYLFQLVFQPTDPIVGIIEGRILHCCHQRFEPAPSLPKKLHGSVCHTRLLHEWPKLQTEKRSPAGGSLVARYSA